MPKGKAIVSPKQFRFMRSMASGSSKSAGPSPDVAKKLLSETSESRKSKFAKAKRPKLSMKDW